MHNNVKAMEHDVSLTFADAFSKGGELAEIRSRCFGNFHRMLAGSYFRSGNYADFAKHALTSVWHRPANVMYFVGRTGGVLSPNN